jgi:hypothetical protein
MKKINVKKINMKTSDITWKTVILQKIRKKNKWIWSYYDRETLVSNLKYRLKRKNDGRNGVTVSHVVPVKQLDQPSVATWSRRSMGSYMKQTIVKVSQMLKCCSGSRRTLGVRGLRFEPSALHFPLPVTTLVFRVTRRPTWPRLPHSGPFSAWLGWLTWLWLGSGKSNSIKKPNPLTKSKTKM